VAGLTFAFGEGGSKRVLAGVLFGVGMAIAAVNFLSWLFPQLKRWRHRREKHMAEARRINRVHRRSPATDDPRRRAKALLLRHVPWRATFNLLNSLLGGLLMFLLSTSWPLGHRNRSTNSAILLTAARLRAQYDR